MLRYIKSGMMLLSIAYIIIGMMLLIMPQTSLLWICCAVQTFSWTNCLPMKRSWSVPAV